MDVFPARDDIHYSGFDPFIERHGKPPGDYTISYIKSWGN
jgi:hypothetical protein